VPLTTISFVGQCHTVGYAGVPADAAFPRVCRDVVQAARPGTRVEVRLQPCYHPADLVESVRAALDRKPHVIVVEAVAWLAVTGNAAVDLSRLPRGVRSSYQRIRHFRHVARSVTRKAPRGTAAVTGVETMIGTLGYALLRPLLPRHPRPSLAEYESCLAAALGLIVAVPETHAVVQGPGAPNFAVDARGVVPDMLERYRAVHSMARRVATAHGALFVDRWDTVTSGFYTDSVRPSLQGHSVWGHLLGAELLQAGLV
jgi:hypothetical protein